MATASMTTTPDDRDEGWPCCPQCAAPRQTACPVCRTPSTDFEFADRLPEAAPTRPINRSDPPVESSRDSTCHVRCNICDELFAATFYDHCHECGHTYRDGIDATTLESEEITPRMIFVATLLAIIFIAAIIYFSWII